MAFELQDFKIQVPSRIPEDAVQDKLGRWWKEVSEETESKRRTQWSYEKNTYYCWFRRQKRPEEGEYVLEMKIKNVYQYRDIKRAVVEFF